MDGFKDEDLFFEVLLLIFIFEKDVQLQNQQFWILEKDIAVWMSSHQIYFLGSIF